MPSTGNWPLQTQEYFWEFGPFRLNELLILGSDGTPLTLSEINRRILLALVKAENAKVSYHELLEAAYGDTHRRNETNLQTAINKIREILASELQKTAVYKDISVDDLKKKLIPNSPMKQRLNLKSGFYWIDQKVLPITKKADPLNDVANSSSNAVQAPEDGVSGEPARNSVDDGVRAVQDKFLFQGCFLGGFVGGALAGLVTAVAYRLQYPESGLYRSPLIFAYGCLIGALVGAGIGAFMGSQLWSAMRVCVPPTSPHVSRARLGIRVLYTVGPLAALILVVVLSSLDYKTPVALVPPAEVLRTFPGICHIGDVSLTGSSDSLKDALAKVPIDGFDAAFGGQEVTVMLDFLSKSGDFLLERRLQTYAQNTVVDVSGGSNVYVSGIKQDEIRNANTLQVNIWRGWISKVGKQEVICQTEAPLRWDNRRLENERSSSIRTQPHQRSGEHGPHRPALSGETSETSHLRSKVLAWREVVS